MKTIIRAFPHTPAWLEVSGFAHTTGCGGGVQEYMAMRWCIANRHSRVGSFLVHINVGNGTLNNTKCVAIIVLFANGREILAFANKHFPAEHPCRL